MSVENRNFLSVYFFDIFHHGKHPVFTARGEIRPQETTVNVENLSMFLKRLQQLEKGRETEMENEGMDEQEEERCRR